jgi:hypothetical protein
MAIPLCFGERKGGMCCENINNVLRFGIRAEKHTMPDHDRGFSRYRHCFEYAGAAFFFSGRDVQNHVRVLGNSDDCHALRACGRDDCGYTL